LFVLDSDVDVNAQYVHTSFIPVAHLATKNRDVDVTATIPVADANALKAKRADPAVLEACGSRFWFCSRKRELWATALDDGRAKRDAGLAPSALELTDCGMACSLCLLLTKMNGIARPAERATCVRRK
jgi:hypothetical protein